nr:FAD-binding oxidoreductase [Dactylosporangium thailandense]
MMRPHPLVNRVAGTVWQSGDAAYDVARSVWNGMVNRRPAAVVACTGPADVAATLRFGAETGLEIGVRCGGHSIAGHAVPDGGLMLDLSPMHAVRVDADRRRAWVQGGALLGAFDEAAQRHGLATTAGNVSHTGVGGLTLGGGMGWLARQVGLTCDNVASYQVVIPSGEVLRASARENRDLFWGLRGGGGNFGVVTEFEFVLHRLDTRALSVEMFFPLREAEPVLRRWRDLLPEAPREATLTAWVGTAGDWAHLPSSLRGQPVANIGYVWVGDPDAGRRFLPALRGGASPVSEVVGELTYLELQRREDDTQGHRYRRYWKGHYFRDFGDEVLRRFLALERGPCAPAASLQAYGGAIAEVPDHESAFGQRDALVELVVAARWSDPAEDADRITEARRYAATMEPFASGAYVNVLNDEGQDGIRRAYRGPKLARLTELKDRYDPGNLLHLNQNIVPNGRR